MSRLSFLVAGLLALPLAALADKAFLTDGRTISGSVRVDDNSVTISSRGQSQQFPRSQVARIDLGDSREAEFSRKLQETPSNDAQAMFALAQLAAENGLKPQADAIYTRVLNIDSNHVGARQALGYVRIDGAWLSLGRALELARGKLESGDYSTLRKHLLPALEAVATGSQAWEVKELAGLTQIRSRDFASATKTFSELSDKNPGLAGAKYEALASILKENADGMYVITEPYPPASELLGKTEGTIKPGPTSLARPEVLQAALRDCAKKLTDAGRTEMELAGKLEASDPNSASAALAKAGAMFDKADILVPDISRSYRVEIARRRITRLRREADTEVAKFDKEIAALGKKAATPDQYHEMVTRMIQDLDGVRDNILAILILARSYPRELIIEITMAETNLKKIDSMRKILVDELDGQK